MNIIYTDTAFQCKAPGTRGGTEQMCRSSSGLHMGYASLVGLHPGFYDDHDPSLANKEGDLMYSGEPLSAHPMQIIGPWTPFMSALATHFSPVDGSVLNDDSRQYMGQIPFVPLIVTMGWNHVLFTPRIVRLLASDFRGVSVANENTFFDGISFGAVHRIPEKYQALKVATLAAARTGGLLHLSR